MCTYNGMPYLRQQLDSLLAQQRLPDQLVIFDDCSGDGTWEFLQHWVVGVSIPVVLRRNAERQGVVQNFAVALQTLQTLDVEVIFLSDQDDIWLPGKMVAMLDVFVANPQVLLVHTNAQLVDHDGTDLGSFLFDAIGLSQREREQVRDGAAFNALCRRNFVTGATAAFRRELLTLAQPFPNCWLHDEWLAILAAAHGRLVLLEQPGILYRQHERNVVGARTHSFLGDLRRLWNFTNLPIGGFQAGRLARAKVLLQRLQSQSGVPEQYLSLMQQALAHARVRAGLPGNLLLRAWAVWRESRSGNYQRFSVKFRGILRDMINR